MRAPLELGILIEHQIEARQGHSRRLTVVDVTTLSTHAGESESVRVRVTGNQSRSDKLTVRLISLVPWEVVGDQAVKRYPDGSWTGLSRVVSSLFIVLSVASFCLSSAHYTLLM